MPNYIEYQQSISKELNAFSYFKATSSKGSIRWNRLCC